MSRVILGGLLAFMLSLPAFGQAPSTSIAVPVGPAAAPFADLVHEAIGAPARVDIGEQATLRLSEDLFFIPRVPAERLMLAIGRPVPPDLEGLLLGPNGVEMAGIVRFVPAGFIDADVMLTFTPDDVLASLQETVTRGNAQREQRGLPPLEARAWVKPPHYDPETHQLNWAALIVPATAPADSGGEVEFDAIAFGADGYVQLSVSAPVEKADEVENLTRGFLAGVSFMRGDGYDDTVASTPRVENGLAKAMRMDSLHKAPVRLSKYFADDVIPVAGAIVAAIGALSLFIYFLRHMRREARRG